MVDGRLRARLDVGDDLAAQRALAAGEARGRRRVPDGDLLRGVLYQKYPATHTLTFNTCDACVRVCGGVCM